MTELKGRRVVDAQQWPPNATTLETGDYMVVDNPDGKREVWFRDPVGHVGRVVTHTITEHEDGTVTVNPSIADEGGTGWHGWLKRGVWSW